MVCKKCHASVEPVHRRIAFKIIEGPHSFLVDDDPEYEEPSPPSTRPGSPVGGSQVDSNLVGIGGAPTVEGYTPDAFGDTTVQGDDIETLEFPTLETLESGDLDVLPIEDSFS